jgi:surface polysaccharide O-acyltransferase-like enzyme
MEIESNVKENSKLVWVELLRIFAAIAVIMVHVTAPNYGTYDINSWVWRITNIYSSSVRWGVPIFLMITGMLMLDANRKIKLEGYFKKYILKYIYIFSAWSLFYVLIEVTFNNSDRVQHGFNNLFEMFIKGYYHLGYFYYLIPFFVLLPIFKVLTENSSRKMIGYILSIWFVFTTFLPVIFQMNDIVIFSEWMGNLKINLINGLIGNFFLGYYLSAFELKKKYRNVLYILGIISLIYVVYSTRKLSIESGTKFSLLRSYTVFTTTICACSIFVFFKYEVNNSIMKLSESVKKIILVIGKCTFGIYLIHPLVLNIFRYYGANQFMANSPARRYPIIMVLVFTVSFIIIYIGKLLVDKTRNYKVKNGKKK